MSKVPVNGDEAEIRNILESIWEMAAEERQGSTEKAGKEEKKKAPSKDLILSSKGPALSGLEGSGQQKADRRPLSEALRGVQLPTGGGQSLTANGTGKPIKHLRTAFAGSSNSAAVSGVRSAASDGSAKPATMSVNGQASNVVVPAKSAQPQQASSTAATSGAHDVERKMAPFLDTRMNRMAAAAPVSSRVSKPPKAPVAQTSPPIVPTTPVVSEPAPVVHVAPAPPAPAPAVVAAPALAPTAPVVVAPPAAPAVVGGAERSLATPHDAAAEMLRPVLRQWLGDNMPRIVETALQIEVAESLKPPQKSGN